MSVTIPIKFLHQMAVLVLKLSLAVSKSISFLLLLMLSLLKFNAGHAVLFFISYATALAPVKLFWFI